jgi:nitrate reductase NapD
MTATKTRNCAMPSANAEGRCLSGIVVTTAPERRDEVAGALAALPGVEVYRTDHRTARIIVVQEALTIDDEADGMRRIRALPGVIDTSLVYHYFGDAAGDLAGRLPGGSG